MRIIFMGTPEFAVPTLMELVGQGHDVAAVYTQPPRPAGRGMQARSSPVQTAAEGLGLPVHHPVSLRGSDAAEAFAAHEADAAVVVAYGLILPAPILSAPAHGAWNVHASVLPRWRGAAPIHRAIMAGDEATGVTIMKMDEGLDTGPIAMIEHVAIGAHDTVATLSERLAHLGADLMVRTLGALTRGTLDLTAQPADGATYAAKIDKAEAAIDFSRSAADVRCHVNGLSPFPGAHAEIGDGKSSERLKILFAREVDGPASDAAAGAIVGAPLTVACGTGAVALERVQRPGKAPMSASEYARGARLSPHARFRLPPCPATS